MDKLDEAFVVDPDSWYARRYLSYLRRKRGEYWRYRVPSESCFENFCHFWRVILFWETWEQFWAAKMGRIPLWGIMAALAYLGIAIAFPVPVLTVTGAIIGLTAIVVGLVAGLIKVTDWCEKVVDWCASRLSWKTREKIETVAKFSFLSSLAVGLLGCVVYLFIVDPWFMIGITGGLLGGAILFYLGYRVLLAIPDPVYHAVGNFGSNVVLPRLSRNVARPIRQTASFIWEIIRSAKHKICPRVIFKDWS